MLHELLLSRDAERPQILIDLGKWNAWCAGLLATPGDLSTIRIGKMAASPTTEPAPDETGATPTADHSTEADIVANDISPADDEPPVEAEPVRTGRKGRKGKLVEAV